MSEVTLDQESMIGQPRVSYQDAPHCLQFFYFPETIEGNAIDSVPEAFIDLQKITFGIRGEELTNAQEVEITMNYVYYTEVLKLHHESEIYKPAILPPSAMRLILSGFFNSIPRTGIFNVESPLTQDEIELLLLLDSNQGMRSELEIPNNVVSIAELIKISPYSNYPLISSTVNADWHVADAAINTLHDKLMRIPTQRNSEVTIRRGKKGNGNRILRLLAKYQDIKDELNMGLFTTEIVLLNMQHNQATIELENFNRFSPHFNLERFIKFVRVNNWNPFLNVGTMATEFGLHRTALSKYLNSLAAGIVKEYPLFTTVNNLRTRQNTLPVLPLLLQFFAEFYTKEIPICTSPEQ